MYEVKMPQQQDAAAVPEVVQANPGPPDYLKAAIASGAGVDVIERLLALQERWEAANARKEFDAATAALRADLPKLIKTSKVNYNSTSYKHEDLAEIIEALAPVLSKHGLSFRWKTASSPTSVSVTCVLVHKSGHSEETGLCAAPDNSGGKNPIQGIGSAVSYLQRYTLKAALGVAAAEDDDGRGGGNASSQDRSSAAKEQKGQKESQAQGKLKALLQSYVNGLTAKGYKTPEGNDITLPDVLQKVTEIRDDKGVVKVGARDVSKLSDQACVYAEKQFHKMLADAKAKAKARQQQAAQ